MTEIDFQIWIWDLFLVLMSGYFIIFANFSSGIKNLSAQEGHCQLPQSLDEDSPRPGSSKEWCTQQCRGLVTTFCVLI